MYCPKNPCHDAYGLVWSWMLSTRVVGSAQSVLDVYCRACQPMDYLDEIANPANLVTNPMMGYRKGRFQIEVFLVDMAIETENGCRLIRPLYFDGLVGPEHNWCQ